MEVRLLSTAPSLRTGLLYGGSDFSSPTPRGVEIGSTRREKSPSGKSVHLGRVAEWYRHEVLKTLLTQTPGFLPRSLASRSARSTLGSPHAHVGSTPTPSTFLGKHAGWPGTYVQSKNPALTLSLGNGGTNESAQASWFESKVSRHLVGSVQGTDRPPKPVLQSSSLWLPAIL